MALTGLAGTTLGVGMLGSLVHVLWRVMARGGGSESDTSRPRKPGRVDDVEAICSTARSVRPPCSWPLNSPA